MDRIDIKPSTVFLFSITLVIADDDTIQYLSRFRRRFLELRAAGHPDPHEGAAFDTLRESGLPMFVTSLAVTLGFLTRLLLNVSRRSSQLPNLPTTSSCAVASGIAH